MPILEVRADEELVEMRTVLSIKERPGVEGILKKSFFFSRLRMHDLHDLNYCLCWVLDKKKLVITGIGLGKKSNLILIGLEVDAHVVYKYVSILNINN